MRISLSFCSVFFLLPAALAESFRCPDVDGSTVTDDGGVQWMIGCYDDTQPPSSFNYIIVENGWNGCFAACRADSNCAAFTFRGEQLGVNGAGRGYCYFKSTNRAATAFFQGRGNDFVGAVKLQYLGGSPGTRPYLDAKFPNPSQFQCPRDSGQVVTDTFGTQYVISCGQDTLQNSAQAPEAQNSFHECFYYCSWTYPGCLAFTYLGGNNGVGAGNCYLKTALAANQFSGGGRSNLVGAILLSNYRGPAITYRATTTTTTAPSLLVRYAYAQAVNTIYFTSVQWVTQTVITSYPVTATSITTRYQTYTSSITVTATTVTTLPDVTTTLQLTTIIPTTVVTTIVYTSIISQTTTLQLTTVVPTTVVTTRFSTLTQTTTISNTVTTTIVPVVTVTPTVLWAQTVTVTPTFG